ncbi:hypothetical protein [Nonomuraea jabiensis]|uniref:Uncharacterized protein n=1 Tax=Nonomuraea jabiensis TaxID=882448 RepID=A0A7W9GJ03_9ACTN|nr:hypothetical protein [Nonomuraea jabiensis]MBB5784576.1 hypothetical protein [Nonomuraea jabiensis]
MGFWGTYIVARANQPLTGLPALRQSAANASWHWQGPDRWRAVQVDRGPAGWDSPTLPHAWDGLLTGLMQQTGHPVLAAVIKHSEGAQLLGRSPVAGHWGGWLMADGITWRSLPADGPAQSWDENGEQHAEDPAEYQRRRQAALDRLYTAAGPPGSAAAPSALAWAREAGLTPDPAAVTTALDAKGVFAEDVLFQLLAALGLPDLPIGYHN